jgi:hypothetical protein
MLVESDRDIETSNSIIDEAKPAAINVYNEGEDEVKGRMGRKRSRTVQFANLSTELITPHVNSVLNCSSVTKDLNSVYSKCCCYKTDDDQCSCEESYFTDDLKEKLNIIINESSSCEGLEVILDTGATAHMFPCSSVFQTYVDISKEKRYVSLGDNNLQVPIIGKGRVELLGEALHVPQLKFGLISISCFDKNEYTVIIQNQKLYMYNLREELYLEGFLRHNLYYLKETYMLKMLKGSQYSNHYIANVASEANQLEIDKKIYNIHNKLGHISLGKLKLAVKNGLVKGLNISEDEMSKAKLDLCYDCMRGRMKADPRGHTTDHEWKLFEKVAVDYKGPFSVQTIHHYTGFYLFSDYYSDYVWVYFVKRKNEFVDALRKFYSKHNDRLNIQMKVLQGDSDVMHKDSITEKFLLDHRGIRLQISAPYSQSQNGQVERDMQNVLDRARTLMSAGGVPNKFWDFAVKHACVLSNYYPSSKSVNNFKSPYELVNGKVPDVGHLEPFYTPGVYHLTKDERRSSNLTNYKAAPCRYLGINPLSPKNYLILDVLNKRVITRKTCRFQKEHIQKSISYFEEQEKIVNTDEEYLDVDREDFDMIQEVDDVENIINAKDKEGSDIEDEDEEDTSVSYWQEVCSGDNNANSPNDNNDVIPIDDNYTEGSTDNEVSTESDINSDKSYLSINLPYYACTCVSDDFHQEWLNNVGQSIKGLSLPVAPKTIQEALNESNPDYDHWYDAINNELDILDEQGTFGGADQFGRAMKTKFIFTTSFKPDFSVKYKARLVVCGYSQVYGLDYEETFAPTTPITNILILLHIAKKRKAVVASFDVKGAFLEGYNDFEQYCWLPEEIDGKKIRVRIIKSLYGQKQSPKIWNDHLNNILIQMGFERCIVSPCLYRYIDDSINYMYTTIHVDDGLMMADSLETVHSFMKEFKNYIKEASLFYPVQKFLGMELEEDEKHIYVHQQEYIKSIELLDINNDCTYEAVPMRSNVNLRVEEQNVNLLPLLPVSGKLRYLSDRSRPDLLVSVGEMSSNGSPHPSAKHYDVARNILRYVKSSMNEKLTLGGESPILLEAYSDASYVTSGNCKSRLGGCLFLGTDSAAVHSFSKNDTTVSHSSCEAEIKAIDLTIKAVMHVRDVLAFMNEEQIDKTTIYTDSKSSISLLETLKSNSNTRHINVRIHFIREALEMHHIQLKFIGTDDNVADGLTKPLEAPKFIKFKSRLINLNS